MEHKDGIAKSSIGKDCSRVIDREIDFKVCKHTKDDSGNEDTANTPANSAVAGWIMNGMVYR